VVTSVLAKWVAGSISTSDFAANGMDVESNEELALSPPHPRAKRPTKSNARFIERSSCFAQDLRSDPLIAAHPQFDNVR
jgi:hypothetical protein